MSGVLDRMAKRALGSLPSVQPLAGPQAAPIPAGLRLNLLDWESTSGPASRARPASEERDDHPPAGARTGARDTDLNDSLRNYRELTGSRAVAPERSEPAAGQAGAKSDGAASETGATTPGESLREPESVSAAQQSRPSRDTETSEGGGAAARPPRWLEAEDADPGAPKDLDRRAAAASAGFARAGRSRRAASREPEPSAESNTEVHISIGSIELRGPRTEARPAAAPFRPRVSLQDYLRRKPEAGA